MPTKEALAVCAEMEEAAMTPIQRAHALHWAGAVRSLAGDEHAHEEIARARAVYADLGMKVIHGGSSITQGTVDLVRGAPAAAEAVLREGDAELEQAGEGGFRSTVLALLAFALCDQGRFDEARTVTEASAAITTPDDVVNVCFVAALRSRLAAVDGAIDEVERAARQALEALERSDNFAFAIALILIAEAKRQIGEVAEARSIASRALALYERKQVPAGVERVKAFLDELARAGGAVSESV